MFEIKNFNIAFREQNELGILNMEFSWQQDTYVSIAETRARQDSVSTQL